MTVGPAVTHFLGDDRRAEALAPEFEEAVVADLPHGSWILTDNDLAAAVGALPGATSHTADARVGNDEGSGTAFGDMPVQNDGLMPSLAATHDGAVETPEGLAPAPAGIGPLLQRG